MIFLKRYSQEIALLFFSVGMLCYALGILNFGKAFNVQTFFHLGALIFILFNFSRFSKQIFFILAIPTITYLILFVLSIVFGIYDEVASKTIKEVIGETNKNLTRFFVFFLCLFLFSKYASKRLIFYFFAFLYLLCLLNVLAIIYMYYMDNIRTAFFFDAVYFYNIWLIMPVAFSLIGIVIFTDWKWKLFFICGFILSLWAIIINGERSILLSSIVMFFVPFFICDYKHRFKIFISVSIIICICIVSFYHYSSRLSPRYNLKHMVDNFFIVWNTSPIEMGQYDAGCFYKNPSRKCEPESLSIGQSDIIIEHSALSRIAMAKSALLAIKDNPFKPHFTSLLTTGVYLNDYYKIRNRNNRVYCGVDKDWNGYSHIHNTWVALLFMYGIIGFAAIILFFGFVLYGALKLARIDNFSSKYIGLSMFVFLCGAIVQSFFDNLYPHTLFPFFAICGAMLGLRWNDENLANN